MAACTFVRGLAIAFGRYRSRPIASRGATWLLALGTLFVCLLPTVRASEAFLWFHYYPYPDCTRGANGDIGAGLLNVHVGAPPAQYTYYAFDIYYNGIYTGQITWQVDAAGVVWNPNGTHVADFTVWASPPPPDPGLWTFINPQSSDPTEIAGMLAVPLTVTYESDCLGLVGSMIPMPIDVYTGRATPTPTPSPTPGTNLTDKDKKVGGNQCDHEKPAMAQYSVHSMLVSLNIEDRPLRYTPPRGPAIDFIVTYNQKETQQPAAFSYSNLGPKWTFNWLSYVSDDPTVQLPQMSVYVPNGGAEIYSFDQGSQSFLPHPQSHATLVKTGSATYERRLPDGSKQIFAQSDGAISYPRRIFMTQMVDPAGNAVTIGYDASFRITTLTDALGLVTTLAYDQPGDVLKITKVTDPFGRFATFQYSSGELTIITDEIGIQSQFTYASGTDSIDSLTTPYGTTNFSSGEDGTNRWIEMTDPLGGKERVEYRDNAPNIPASDPVAPNIPGIVNSGLDVANTFYWDKKAMAGRARRLHQGEDYPLALQRRWVDLRHRLQRKGGLGESRLVHLRRATGSHARRPEREPVAGRACPWRRQHAVVTVRIQHNRQDDESDRSVGPGHQFDLRHEQCRSARSPANHGHQ